MFTKKIWDALIYELSLSTFNVYVIYYGLFLLFYVSIIFILLYCSLAAFCNIAVARLCLFGSMFCFMLIFILMVCNLKTNVSPDVFTLFLCTTFICTLFWLQLYTKFSWNKLPFRWIIFIVFLHITCYCLRIVFCICIKHYNYIIFV